MNCVSPKRSVGILPHPAPRSGNRVGNRIVAGVISPGKMRSYWRRVGLSSNVTAVLKRRKTETHRGKPRLSKEASHVRSLTGGHSDCRKGAWLLSPPTCGCEALSDLC